MEREEEVGVEVGEEVVANGEVAMTSWHDKALVYCRDGFFLLRSEGSSLYFSSIESFDF